VPVQGGGSYNPAFGTALPGTLPQFTAPTLPGLNSQFPQPLTSVPNVISPYARTAPIPNPNRYDVNLAQQSTFADLLAYYGLKPPAATPVITRPPGG
jgi:hypothetical protein